MVKVPSLFEALEDTGSGSLLLHGQLLVFNDIAPGKIQLSQLLVPRQLLEELDPTEWFQSHRVTQIQLFEHHVLAKVSGE